MALDSKTIVSVLVKYGRDATEKVCSFSLGDIKENTYSRSDALAVIDKIIDCLDSDYTYYGYRESTTFTNS